MSEDINTGLRREHLRQLEASGITYFPHFGITSSPKGLAFQYFDPKTKTFNGYTRVRLDEPLDGMKYTQPKGSECRLYFNPVYGASRDLQAQAWYDKAISGNVPIYIVEGEKKALSLQLALKSRGFVIGLGGVQNWSKKRQDGEYERVLIDDFKLIGFGQRRVYILFDSDVMTNEAVMRAEKQLTWALKDQLRVGAQLLTLPPGPKGEKVGIDDFIVDAGAGFTEEWNELLKGAIQAGNRQPLPRPHSGAELIDTKWEIEGTTWGTDLVPLIIEGGTFFVHADSGVGKTYFMMQLAASLQAAHPFLGFPVPTRRKVLFFQQELGPGWFAKRVRKLEAVFGTGVRDIAFVSGDLLLASQDRYRTATLITENLESMIRLHAADVVVLDPLQGYYDMSESSTDHSREFMKAIVGIAKRTGAAILMSHHDRKDKTGDSMHHMRGGSPFTDLADTVLGIQRIEVDDETVSETFQDGFNDDGERVCKFDGVPLSGRGNKAFCNPNCRLKHHRERVKRFATVSKYHPKDLRLAFEKVRHADGPKPDYMRLTRIPDLPGAPFANPYFMEAIDDGDTEIEAANVSLRGEVDRAEESTLADEVSPF